MWPAQLVPKPQYDDQANAVVGQLFAQRARALGRRADRDVGGYDLTQSHGPRPADDLANRIGIGTPCRWLRNLAAKTLERVIHRAADEVQDQRRDLQW